MSDHASSAGHEPGEQTGSGEQMRSGEQMLSQGIRWAWLGGVAAGVVAIVGQMLVGFVYNGFEAHSLLQALIPSARSFGAAVVQASATVLALMLTLLGLSRKEIRDLERGFFRRVEEISLLSSIGLASAILLLLFLSIPLQQSPSLPANWFQIIYYVMIVVVAAIAGLVIATVIMLYNAIQSIIQAVRPGPSPVGRGQQESEKHDDEG